MIFHPSGKKATIDTIKQIQSKADKAVAGESIGLVLKNSDLAMKAMAGGLGMEIDLAAVPAENGLREDRLLYSESAGRFIVTIDPQYRVPFENLFTAMPMACIGRVTGEPRLTVRGLAGKTILDLTVPGLKAAWQKTFGDLI